MISDHMTTQRGPDLFSVARGAASIAGPLFVFGAHR